MPSLRHPPLSPAICYLALGTNLGDRGANLQSALVALGPKVQVGGCSAVYETIPWGFADQPPFLNQVLKGQTTLSPLDLLSHLKEIEAALGRVPTFRFGPRLIDLDILFYADWTLDTPELILPHPHLHERAFVLVPLNDLAPDLRHPVLGQTVRQLLAGIDTTGVRFYATGF